LDWHFINLKNKHHGIFTLFSRSSSDHLLGNWLFRIQCRVNYSYPAGYCRYLNYIKNYPGLTVIEFTISHITVRSNFFAARRSISGKPNCMSTSGYFIGSIYLLTQIYQHEADKNDGVISLSYNPGYIGAFIFSSIFVFCFSIA